jgi:ABC-type multidrug transport system ATPase subunit
MNILEVQALSKNYGHIKALREVSFSVPKGSVFGILGPNGSGKTTLLGIITDILKASNGQYKIFEETPSHEHRKKIGTLLETPNFYHYLNALQNLTIAAEIKGRGHGDIEQVLETVNLSKRKSSPFSTYSLGMKQRLAIGSTLLGNPDVLIFDEPLNGLDPVGIAEIRTLIKSLSAQGKTILLASHLLDEVEKVCTHVAILKQGQLLATGSVEEVFSQKDIVQINAQNQNELIALMQQYPCVHKVATLNQLVEVTFDAGTANLEQINLQCFKAGITLSHLQLKKGNIESRFLELTGN